MFSKGRKKDTLRFSVKPRTNVTKVHLAGDFNGWKPTAMRKQKDGSFVSIVSAKAGAYEYKFVFDGDWVSDPDNHMRAMNAYGTANSVAIVE